MSLSKPTLSLFASPPQINAVGLIYKRINDSYFLRCGVQIIKGV